LLPTNNELDIRRGKLSAQRPLDHWSEAVSFGQPAFRSAYLVDGLLGKNWVFIIKPLTNSFLRQFLGEKE
jgi:hypothetical protein